MDASFVAGRINSAARLSQIIRVCLDKLEILKNGEDMNRRKRLLDRDLDPIACDLDL